MDKISMSANLIDNMAFEMDLNGHRFIMDANESVGGNNLGPRPKPLLLAGLIGCTGMDVVSILKKMKVELDDLNISVEADATTEHPKVYENIKLIYKFRGRDLPMDKLEKAVTLSQDRYCGVTAMLRKATDITHEIIIEDSQN
ncbi:MAG: OsmC family protein [Tissierellaceae bacterium]|nr:OsmC family protein [Tissierellaceae bacterium]